MENLQDGNLNTSRTIKDNYVFLEIVDIKEKNPMPKSDFKIIEDLNDIHEIKVFGQSKNSSNILKNKAQKNTNENNYSNCDHDNNENVSNEFLQNANVGQNENITKNNENEEKNLGKKLNEEDLYLLIESLCHELFHCQEIDYLSQSRINIIFKIMNDEDKYYVIEGVRARISNEYEACIFESFVNNLY